MTLSWLCFSSSAKSFVPDSSEKAEIAEYAKKDWVQSYLCFYITSAHSILLSKSGRGKVDVGTTMINQSVPRNLRPLDVCELRVGKESLICSPQLSTLIS